MTDDDSRDYTLTFNPKPDPAIKVGTPMYCKTTDGEKFTLYVVEVTEDGRVKFGPDKP